MLGVPFILSAFAMGTGTPQPAPILKVDEAVAIGLRNSKELVAARLDVEAAEVERLAARTLPNPALSYTLGNLVLGSANGQGSGVTSGPFGQTVHTFALSTVLDVWFKRSRRTAVAERGVETQQLQVEDALREVTHAVRAQFAEVVREQQERRLAKETLAHYEETIRITRERFKAGDISETELQKIELEGVRFQAADLDAQLQLDVARQGLASLLGLAAAYALPELEEVDPPRVAFPVEKMIGEALQTRPDVRAVRSAMGRDQASIAAEQRAAYPDPTVGVAYTRDFFTVSGDNPHTLALTLALPLPIFDRNQAGIARAHVDLDRTKNDLARLDLQVRREVADAALRSHSAGALLQVFEGGMLERAENALRIAEKAYRAGATSLLELLEAQRTYIETRAQYLKTLADYRQASIDVAYAVGADLK